MMPPYPVLLMVQALDAGGTERQLTELALALDRSRFSPHVACFRVGGMRWHELQRAGIPMLHIPVTSLASFATMRTIPILAAYLREHRIQLVHTFDMPANLYGVPAARFLRAPIVLSSQRSFRSLRAGVLRDLMRLTDRLVDGVVVNCRAVQRNLTEEDKVPAGQIHLCYNGIDAIRFQPRRPDFRVGPLVIGFIGVLRREKGLSTLLQAFSQLSPAEGSAELSLIGWGPSERALAEEACALGLGSRVAFHPAISNVEEALREIDIFVLPSYSEALSNSLMEAMACGCAVVASRVGGNSELVTHDETGLLFEAGNSGELAACLRRLIGDEQLRRRLGRQASERIRGGFGVTDSARRMGAIYEGHLSV
jgi:glycosyltransferase involved in cell wall biosynthesis